MQRASSRVFGTLAFLVPVVAAGMTSCSSPEGPSEGPAGGSGGSSGSGSVGGSTAGGAGGGGTSAGGAGGSTGGTAGSGGAVGGAGGGGGSEGGASGAVDSGAGGASGGSVDARSDAVATKYVCRTPAMAVDGGTGGWRLAPTKYATNDRMVMGASIADYGVTGDGATDVTATFQKALNALGKANASGTITGGTLFVPEGKYVLRGTLIIPKGVTLAGDWEKPVRGQPVKGTVLMAYSGANDATATPFITIQPNAKLRDVNIWYPDQKPDAIVPYPSSVRMFDPTVWGADGTWVTNVTLVNSYFGIQQGPAGNGCANLQNIYGTPLFKGIDMDASSDIDRWDFIDFSPAYWAGSGLPGSPAAGSAYATFIKNKGTGIALGRIDWSYLAFATVDGYYQGLLFRESTQSSDYNAQGVKTGHSYPDGHCYGVTLTNCATGLEVEGSASVGEILSNFEIKNCGIGVHVQNNQYSTDGNIEIGASSISASDYAIRYEGRGHLFVRQTTIGGGKVTANNGVIDIIDSDLNNASPQVTLDPGTVGAVIVGNRSSTALAIQDNGATKVVKDNATPLNLPKPSAFPDVSYTRHAPTCANLYVVTDAPFNAVGDSVSDATAAIQAALTQAGKDGGGVVFVPPGQYKLLGTLTVPSNVELQGAVEVGRMPIKLGSILEVYGGKGNADATPTVILSADAGIRGVVFHQPEQNNLALTPYPYVIRGSGANAYAIDVALSNIFNGIDLFTNRNDNHYVEYLGGVALNNALRVGGGSNGGRVVNMQMNIGPLRNGAETKWGSWETAPANADVGAVDTYIQTYMQTNADTAIYGDAIGEVIYNNFSWLSRNGVYLKRENGTGPSGWVVGQGVDWSRHSVFIEDIGPAGMDFVNTQLVSVNVRTFGDYAYVTTSDTFTKTARFFNVTCWGGPDYNLDVKGGTLDIFSGIFTQMGSKSFSNVSATGTLAFWNTFINNGSPSIAAANPGRIDVSSSVVKTNPNTATFHSWVNNL
jgi:hypothetical protein